MIDLRCGDCLKLIKKIYNQYDKDKIVIVTDPPFNIGYKYNSYKDNLKEEEYYKMLCKLLKGNKSVIIHYPENLHKLSIKLRNAPEKVISWVYNSNTGKQHRDIAFFNIKPDMSKVRQPYKNLNDKRIKERIARGCTGSKLYDWWNINQVKNVSKEKTEHPCQMPLQVMERIIGILPADYIILDPFMGSGTTGVACKNLNRDFIGIEIDEKYFEIAKNRIENSNKQLNLFEYMKEAEQ